ncbi:alkaline phosphatase D family protein [Pontixanthobacter sp.]|uniref:alkaline phosphatase D family protein n=1 Tax=Pontixanthobacter sp. TaxID=2792078 RepID=UPI003C79A785
MTAHPPASPDPCPTLPSLAAMDRRSLLRSGVAGAAGLAALPGLASAKAATGFGFGVASGEPGQNSVLLWTRYAAMQDTALTWEVSDDDSFTAIIASGTAIAKPAHDFCVKPVATGLEPGTWYFYRFIGPDGGMSDIGRTRTLPAGAVDRFRLGVFSCSNLGFGYFNAYGHAAQDNAFDLILHLGDYFYEYNDGRYPSAAQKVAGRAAWPDHETVVLADYRLRHASYRADPDLRRMTQLYPMILGWDDHESANDSWTGGAENHDPGEGDWGARKRAAMRAYREWLPVSDADYAAYEVGDLATLFRLETRLGARSEQFSVEKLLEGKGSADQMTAALDAFRGGDFVTPERTILGTAQENWLADGLKASRISGTVWQVLVQQVLMGKLASPDSLLEGLAAAAPADIKSRLQAAALASKAGLPLNMDAWDGYPAARDRLLASAMNADANLLVLAGDTHNAWAFDLAHDSARAGIEFGVQGVTSPGLETYLGMVPPKIMQQSLVGRNAELQWADTSQRGYMAVELTPTQASCEWRFVSGVKSRSVALAGKHRMVSRAGSNQLSQG